jgi:opacity protein-like surface antigen
MKKIIFSAALLFASVAMVNAQMTWGVKAGYNNSNYNIGAQDASFDASLGSKHGFYAGALGNYQFAEQFSLQFELLYSLDGTKLSMKDKVMEQAWGAMVDAGYIPADMKALDKFSAAANFHNINVPVLIKFQPVGGLSVLAGPTFSYTVANGVKLNKDAEDLAKLALTQSAPEGPAYDDYMDYAGKVVGENIAKFKLNLTLGVEYACCDNMFIEARYNYSLLNSFKDEFIAPAESKLGIEESKITVKDNLNDIQPKAKYHSFQVGLGYKF